MEIRNKFVVIDDSPTVRKHVAYLLKLLSTGEEEIMEAANPKEALTHFRTTPPSIVFLDMMLPREQDGTNTLKLLLAEKPDTRVVLVTALDQNHRAVRGAISRGAAAYLRKPLTLRALQQVLEELEAQSGRFRRVS